MYLNINILTLDLDDTYILNFQRLPLEKRIEGVISRLVQEENGKTDEKSTITEGNIKITLQLINRSDRKIQVWNTFNVIHKQSNAPI